jgi:hypothetical protein
VTNLEGAFYDLRLDGVLRNSLWGDLVLYHRLGWLRGGYGIRVPMHYLPGALLGWIDHRNPESGRLDHDDVRPPQVRANRVRAQILSR